VLVVAALGAVAPPAHAGSYTVFACGSYDNRSWNSVGGTGITADETCPGATTMGNAVGGGARVPLGSTGTTTFIAPTGMTIADFTLTRQLTYRNGAPADGTRRLYAIYKLGDTVFAGAGHYDNATRNRLNAVGSWYGYREKNIVVPRSTVSRASFPALAGYAGTATSLQIAVGCFNGTVNTPCSVAAGGGVSHLLSGAQVVLDDPTAPTASIEASGLLAGGPHSGADPITLDASDNGGIRRAEIIDVTASGSSVVGVEDYAAGARTDLGATCSFRLRRACPVLTNETVHPTGLPAGRRTLKVRIVDAGGNVLEQGPYAVDVTTPSDRGLRNGTDATRRRHAERPLHRHHQGAPHRRLPSQGPHLGPTAELRRAADRGRRPARAHARSPLRRALRGPLRGHDRLGRRLPRDRARRRLAPHAGRLALAHEGPGLPGERLRDAQRTGLVVAERAPAGDRYRRAAAPQRHRPRHAPLARRPADLPGPHRPRALHDVRRGPRQPQGPLQQALPLPLGRLARAQVHVPRQAPRRRPLPLRGGLLQARDRPRPLRPGPETK
jgi:hypothetical protein